MSWEVRQGDALGRLREMPDGSVQTCITSPPYWGLRDYGEPGQLGLEATPQEYVANLVAVFAEVRRVLRDDGTLWLNLGDSYCNIGHGKANRGEGKGARGHRETEGTYEKGRGFAKHKDLLGMPWRVAFALQEDGWWLRSDIVWAKPNPMPESVTDRPTRSHEYLFLLTKSARYLYDADAVREDAPPSFASRGFKASTQAVRQSVGSAQAGGTGARAEREITGRNKRSVWTVATQPFSGWGLADRRVPVEADDADDDTQRIASPDCPVHAGLSASVPRAQRGGHAAARSPRSPDTYVDPAQGLLLDSAPTGQSHGLDSPAESSDSLDQSPPALANGRSTGSRRTDPALATTQPCTPSAQSPGRTHGTSDQPASSGRHPDTTDRNSGGAGSGDLRGSGTPDRTAHKPSLSGGSACTCEFYRVERSDHFATFPPKLIEPCVLAGSKPEDVVLDPFSGAGTTGLVALRHNRSYIGLELSPVYAEMSRNRLREDQPMFNVPSEVAA